MRRVLILLSVAFASWLVASPALAQETFYPFGPAGCAWRSGSGSPETGVVGAVCDWYEDTVTGDLYQKRSGAGNTGWARVASVGSANTFAAAYTQTFSGPVALNGLIASHLVPTLTDTYDLGSSVKWWNQGYLSQMNAVLFAKETATLNGGWFIVGKNAGTFAADVGSGDATADFGQAMTVGHFILIRAADGSGTVKAEYLQVGALVSGTTYNVTRDLAAAHATDPAWSAGTPYLVLGTTGSGRIELNAYDTPRISILKQGATYNAQTEYVRIGYLDSFLGIAAGKIGLGIGDATNYLTYYDGALTVKGTGTFDAGNIGGWTINSAYLAKDTGTDNTSSGFSPTDYPVYVGKTYANRATAPFRVTPAGAVTATNAAITGTFMAGNVLIDSNGVSLTVPTLSYAWATNAYRFVSNVTSSSEYGMAAYGSKAAGYQELLISNKGNNYPAGEYIYTTIIAQNNGTSGSTAEIDLRATLGPSYIYLTATNLYLDGDTTTLNHQFTFADGGYILNNATNGIRINNAANSQRLVTIYDNGQFQFGDSNNLPVLVGYPTAIAGVPAGTYFQYRGAGIPVLGIEHEDDPTLRSWPFIRGDGHFLVINAKDNAHSVYLNWDPQGDVQVYNIYTHDGGVHSWSDSTIKSNVKPYADGLAAIRKINPVTFGVLPEYGGKPGEELVGVVAQQMELALPRAVSMAKWVKTRPTDASDGDIRAINTAPIFWALVNATKELDADLAKLRLELEALKAAALVGKVKE